MKMATSITNQNNWEQNHGNGNNVTFAGHKCLLPGSESPLYLWPYHVFYTVLYHVFSCKPWVMVGWSNRSSSGWEWLFCLINMIWGLCLLNYSFSSSGVWCDRQVAVNCRNDWMKVSWTLQCWMEAIEERSDRGDYLKMEWKHQII